MVGICSALPHGSRPAPSLAGRRVLVAEDEAMIAMLLEELVTGLGAEVAGPYARVKDVAQCIECQRLDGALLDVNLRGEPVFSVLPRLAQLGIPFIVTSGYDAQSLFPPELRGVPRVSKPFDEDELARLCLKLFGI